MRVGTYLRQNVDSELQVDERTLRQHVAARRAVLVPREAFVRARYAPGDQSQFDFSPMSVLLAGVVVVVQLFVVRLSYSGRFMARASMRCDQPSLFAGLLAGFTAFGGLTRTSIFDNASTAVARVLRGRSRTENEAFAAFSWRPRLHVAFAAPAKGNEKGGVEGVHGYIEDNFFRPLPSYGDLDELNEALVVFCDASLSREHTAHQETIGDRFAREQPMLQALPTVLPRPCVTRYARVNKVAEVCFERNWYSVPTRWAHRNAVIEVYELPLRIVVDAEVVAEHQRGFGAGERFLDPRHYLTLLAHKHRAAESALVLSDGRIPDVLRDSFDRYRQNRLPQRDEALDTSALAAERCSGCRTRPSRHAGAGAWDGRSRGDRIDDRAKTRAGSITCHSYVGVAGGSAMRGARRQSSSVCNRTFD